MIDSYIQVLTFVFSFIYGILFFFLNEFVKYILVNKSIFTKFLINIIFVIDIVLLYVYIMFNINHGNYHIYYIIVLVLGWLSAKKIINKCKIIVKRLKHTK
jgi:hypothetical protein